ncbi:transposase [Sphingobium yanoikuyae]|uniref:Transposase n=1 Tax=Sphingobium yanoikuyae TaxID=13690 RepID=A0A6M4G7P4_SPHYA|nr:transposase [Sphingobium yanoikuyae]
MLGGIIIVNRNGLRWRDAPKEYGPSKTLYNRWKRCGEKGMFVAMMDGLPTDRRRTQDNNDRCDLSQKRTERHLACG